MSQILPLSEVNLNQIFINRIKRQMAREQKLLSKALARKRESEIFEDHLKQQAEIEAHFRTLEVTGTVTL